MPVHPENNQYNQIAFQTERLILSIVILGIHLKTNKQMNKKPYSSAIKKTPFKYVISRKIAKLMLDGLNREEIFEQCCDHNVIEIESPERRREITGVVYERLCALDSHLLSTFHFGDVVTSKFLLVYAIAKTDALFFDFLFEVYREALLGEKQYLSINDFDTFFASKKQTDLIVAKWGTFTLKCLTKGYRNILVESGLGQRNRKTIIVQRIMIHPEIEEYLASIGQSEYLQAILGR